MVFSTAETALVMPMNFEAHLDDFTTALSCDDDVHVAPGLDWLHSAMPDEHDIFDRLNTFSPTQQLEDQDWDDVVLDQALDVDLSTTSGSGLSSPIDSPSFGADDLFECHSSSVSPTKRKADYDDDEDDDDFDDIKAKKAKVKKMSGTPKTRRVHDESTIRAIAMLRADSLENPESRRRIHNVLERKRRNDLKSSYEELRECIPELENSDRAPTGQILAKAVDLIAELQEEDQKIQAAIAALRIENERLRASLVA